MKSKDSRHNRERSARDPPVVAAGASPPATPPSARLPRRLKNSEFCREFPVIQWTRQTCSGVPASSSIAVFTRADTASVSATVIPAVEITSPTRISNGWLLM